mgnify:FL=1
MLKGLILNLNLHKSTKALLRDTLLILCCFISIVHAPLSYSHADHEKARFVSPDGNDIGKCDDPENPCKTVSYAGLKSNKGDRILLAEGNYAVDNVDTLCLLYTSDAADES